MRRTAALTACLVAVATLALAAEARGAWRRPVLGPVLGRFHTTPGAPFARGQRRGVDLATEPGQIVRAPCAGRVSFAGRLPGGSRGASVRCGALTATVLGLRVVGTRRGASVSAGARLGRADGSGRLRLGARVTARRFGYVDPLRLLGAEPLPRPVLAPLRGPRTNPPTPVAPSAAPAPAPSRRPGVVRAPPATPPPARHPTPLTAWLGLGAITAGLLTSARAGHARAAARRRPARANTAEVAN